MAQVSFQDAGGRLYGEMQKCIIYIQNHPDQDITMEWHMLRYSFLTCLICFLKKV